MIPSRAEKISRTRRAPFRRLALALTATLLTTYAVAVCPEGSGAAAQADAPLAAAAAARFVVNSTGDGDRFVNRDTTVCETAPGNRECTLRAAIQTANASAGEGQIGFSIPSTQPNCNAATGACTIGLTKALPVIAESVAITGPGGFAVLKSTVRADARHQVRH